jgi:hypothetical protein
VALDFFTLMTTDCEHCLRPNRQIKQQCDKQNDHYLNPKRVLHAEEIASKVFFFRLAFKAVAGPDLKVVNAGAYEYFVMQVCIKKDGPLPPRRNYQPSLLTLLV